MTRLGVIGLTFLGAILPIACRQQPAPSAGAGQDPNAPIATQVIRKFQLQDMRDGEKSMMLISTTASLFEEAQYADVSEPQVFFYQKGVPNKVSSQLTAPQGRVQMKTHEVEAWGGVTVVTADSSTLKTDRLRYDPTRRKILSDSAVELRRPGAVTRGLGLESDPELKRVRIRQQRAELTETR